MKDFETIKNSIVYYGNSYSFIYPCLERVEKKLKALEIIKETRVDTNFIKLSKNYDDYCGMEVVKMLNHIETAEQKGITQEEYDLLREVL